MITLKTLPQATALEVFNQVEEHLLSQNKKSIDLDSGACKYRYNDLSCAAGCLIADDEYSESMEGDTWQSLVEKGVAPNTHRRLIQRLQTIHDDRKVEEWPQKLAELKDEMGLNANSPSQ